MMDKAYFLFLCILLISGLFLPSSAAGRALLETTETASEASSVYEVLTQYPSSGGPAGFGILVKHFLCDSCVMAEGRGGNDGSKMGVIGSHSKPASSRTEFSSPSKPTTTYNRVTSSTTKPAVSCTRDRYAACLPRSNPTGRCSLYDRNCK